MRPMCIKWGDSMAAEYVGMLVRVGIVTDINEKEREARVYFEDVNIVSGWLKIIKSPPFIPKKHVTQETEAREGGTWNAAFEAHTHEVKISPWLPDINDTVLCLYDQSFNGDGYILGAL